MTVVGCPNDAGFPDQAIRRWTPSHLPCAAVEPGVCARSGTAATKPKQRAPSDHSTTKSVLSEATGRDRQRSRAMAKRRTPGAETSKSSSPLGFGATRHRDATATAGTLPGCDRRMQGQCAVAAASDRRREDVAPIFATSPKIIDIDPDRNASSRTQRTSCDFRGVTMIRRSGSIPSARKP